MHCLLLCHVNNFRWAATLHLSPQSRLKAVGDDVQLCHEGSSPFLHRFLVIMYRSSLVPKTPKWWLCALFNFGTISKGFFEVCIFFFFETSWLHCLKMIQWKHFVLRYANPFLPPNLFENSEKKSSYLIVFHIHETHFSAEYFILLVFIFLINGNCFVPAVS